MKNFIRHTLTLLAFLLASVAMAQSRGRIFAQLFDAKTKEPMPYVAVQIFSGGTARGGGQSNIEGEFRSPSLTPGRYDVHFSYVGYQKRIIKNVKVIVDSTTYLGVSLSEFELQIEEVIVTDYKKPRRSKGESIRNVISTKYTDWKPTRDISAIDRKENSIVNTGGDEGYLIIRGTRKVDSSATPPSSNLSIPK